MQLTPWDSFCAAMAPVRLDLHSRKLGLAVSGGGDSMALLDLADRWARDQGWSLHIVTVDHGLRPESADEASFVAEEAARLGWTHDTLRWTGWDGTGNLQAEARAARRGLISDWADRQGLDCVLLGHTADDQAETLLMRLARGSGVDGLAGMQATDPSNPLFFRPLLQVSRKALRDHLTARGKSWEDDPSNEDPRFDRIKARQMMAHLESLGLTRDRLLQTARHMRLAQGSLKDHARHIARAEITEDRGDLILSARLSHQDRTEVRLRLVAEALRWIGGGTYRPRLHALTEALETAQTTPTTLSGCILMPDPSEARAIRITREAAAAARTGPTTEIWDNRWQLTGPHAPGLSIAALGEAVSDCPDWRDTGLPRTALLASPAVWRGETLLAAPLAGKQNGWKARIVTPFADWLDSR